MPVRLEGAIALRKALRAFEPQLAKELTKEEVSFLKPIVKQAREYLPKQDQIISNWSVTNKKDGAKFPYYDFAVARRGLKYKTTPSRANSRGFTALASILNSSAVGAIFETAGRKTGDSVFVRNLNAKYSSKMVGQGKMSGRAMFRAWEEDRGKAQAGVIRAIENAAEKFKAATNG